MLKSFACEETEAIWREEGSRRLPAQIQQRALNKLALLNRASRLADLRVPPGQSTRSAEGRSCRTILDPDQ
jgi:proteic killer suppression protein